VSRPAGALTTALKPTGLNAFYIDAKAAAGSPAGRGRPRPSRVLAPAVTGFPVYVVKGQQPR
jgi:hypothetical protein